MDIVDTSSDDSNPGAHAWGNGHSSAGPGAPNPEERLAEMNGKPASAHASASDEGEPGEQPAGDLWEQCREIAQAPHILERLVEEMQQTGVVGEERNIKLLYLALTSRVLDTPISLAVKGPSSGGKSFLIDSVTQLFPKDAYYSLTSTSEKALLYTEESFKHRILIFAEAESLKNDFISYVLRTLLSEGRLHHATVMKTETGKLKTITLDKEGPTGLIASTTAVRLHPENETRYWSLPVTDTEAQTRAIMKAAARQEQPPIDPHPWQALQTWISKQPASVHIPYAEALARLVYAGAIRMRRDFERFLTLIRSSTILHQATRERHKDGSIVASIQDYCIAYELASDLMAYGVQVAVPPGVRRLVDAVNTLTAEGQPSPGSLADRPTTTKTAVAQLLGVDNAQVTRWCREAEKLGYIVNLENNSRRPAHLCLGDPLPENTEVLPSPERLLAVIGREEV